MSFHCEFNQQSTSFVANDQPVQTIGFGERHFLQRIPLRRPFQSRYEHHKLWDLHQHVLEWTVQQSDVIQRRHWQRYFLLPRG
jgi:hypothetical protein